MRILLIVGLLMVLFGCTDKAVQSDSIYGKWKLMEYYYSIGSPGEWKLATPETVKFLEFKEDGNVVYSGPGTQSFSESFRLNKDTIVFVRNIGEMGVRYEIKNNTLRIFPPCIEGCGEAYIRYEGNEK